MNHTVHVGGSSDGDTLFLLRVRHRQKSRTPTCTCTCTSEIKKLALYTCMALIEGSMLALSYPCKRIIIIVYIVQQWTCDVAPPNHKAACIIFYHHTRVLLSYTVDCLPVLCTSMLTLHPCTAVEAYTTSLSPTRQAPWLDCLVVTGVSR